MTHLIAYDTTILVFGFMGLLMLLQLLVADVFAIKSGKTPGVSAEADHNSFVFRSERAFLNTNESVAIFLLFAGFSILSSANPSWLNSLSLSYALARVFHMLFYYFDIRLARSAAFVISLLALAGMFVVGLLEWLR